MNRSQVIEQLPALRRYARVLTGDAWAADDLFASPGPRQLWGPAARQLPMTVALNEGSPALDFVIGD